MPPHAHVDHLGDDELLRRSERDAEGGRDIAGSEKRGGHSPVPAAEYGSCLSIVSTGPSSTIG